MAHKVSTGEQKTGKEKRAAQIVCTYSRNPNKCGMQQHKWDTYISNKLRKVKIKIPALQYSEQEKKTERVIMVFFIDTNLIAFKQCFDEFFKNNSSKNSSKLQPLHRSYKNLAAESFC